MKKILIGSVISAFMVLGIGLGAFATEGTPSPTATATARPTKTPDAVVAACVKSAVEKRETAVITAFDGFSSSTKSALLGRKSELGAAWSLSDATQRRTAVKAAWDKFREAKKASSKAFKTAKDQAWRQFSTDRKACKASSTGENPGHDLSF